MPWLFASGWHSNNREVRCPHCGRGLMVPRRPETERISCPTCGKPFLAHPTGRASTDGRDAGRRGRPPRGR